MCRRSVGERCGYHQGNFHLTCFFLLPASSDRWCLNPQGWRCIDTPLKMEDPGMFVSINCSLFLVTSGIPSDLVTSSSWKEQCQTNAKGTSFIWSQSTWPNCSDPTLNPQLVSRKVLPERTSSHELLFCKAQPLVWSCFFCRQLTLSPHLKKKNASKHAFQL